jgi:hypothetical protein
LATVGARASLGSMSTTLLLADREPFLERHLREGGFELLNGGGRPDLVLGRPEADPLERVRAFREGCDDYR